MRYHYRKFSSLPLLLTIFNSLIFSAVASNNDLSISGKVVTCCGTPISNATIKLLSKQLSCTTDSTGSFHLLKMNVSVESQPLTVLNQGWEKIEVFDLQGNRLLKYDRKEPLSLVRGLEITRLSCIILRNTVNSITTSYKMIAPFSISKIFTLQDQHIVMDHS